ncbi:MAG TPA: hypothetical protein VLA04_06605 [Verrucomicrobiae bacterium]|nr:hypothetical protein [Verrucomicrobiae bacterium]
MKQNIAYGILGVAGVLILICIAISLIGRGGTSAWIISMVCGLIGFILLLLGGFAVFLTS